MASHHSCDAHSSIIKGGVALSPVLLRFIPAIAGDLLAHPRFFSQLQLLDTMIASSLAEEFMPNLATDDSSFRREHKGIDVTQESARRRRPLLRVRQLPYSNILQTFDSSGSLVPGHTNGQKDSLLVTSSIPRPWPTHGFLARIIDQGVCLK